MSGFYYDICISGNEGTRKWNPNDMPLLNCERTIQRNGGCENEFTLSFWCCPIRNWLIGICIKTRTCAGAKTVCQRMVSIVAILSIVDRWWNCCLLLLLTLSAMFSLRHKPTEAQQQRSCLFLIDYYGSGVVTSMLVSIFTLMLQWKLGFNCHEHTKLKSAFNLVTTGWGFAVW